MGTTRWLLELVLCLSCLAGVSFQIPQIGVQYWGPGNPKPDDVTIKPFTVHVSDEELKYLKDKLENTRELQKPLEGVGFDYGINTDYLSQVVQYWKTKYDWREREKFLNSLPQFVTQIGGLGLHFIHVKPDPVVAKGKKIVPLLFLHGWPSSSREAYGLVPRLTAPSGDRNFVFEVVAPSLPGFGFSEGAAKPGLGGAHMGALLDQLMARLGHTSYVILGGDWGSNIGYAMSVLYPNRIQAYLSTSCMPTTTRGKVRALAAYLLPQLFVRGDKRQPYKQQFLDTFLLEFGFFHIQATKPDTIGVALTDSPVGLAAYFLEKFSTWTNKAFRTLPDGGLGTWDMDLLLDNINIYWFTKSITTSMRIYAESFNKKYIALGIDKETVRVPTGCIRTPHDLLHFPDFVLKGVFPDLRIADMGEGGHFPAFERPAGLAEQVWRLADQTLARKKLLGRVADSAKHLAGKVLPDKKKWPVLG